MKLRELFEFCKDIPLESEIEVDFRLELVDEGSHLKIESRDIERYRRGEEARGWAAFAAATRNSPAPTGYGK